MKYLFSLLIFLLGFSVGRLHAQTPVDLKSIHKILFAGDSITHHKPAPELNWTGDWGMAASAADKDYVHLFLAKLAALQGAGAAAPEIWISGQGGGKVSDQLSVADKITAFHADLALVQLGENDHTDITVTGFQQPYEKLLAAIRAGNPNARILCAGVWGLWPNAGDHTKDIMIRAACQKYGATFADLGGAFADTANRVASENRFTNTGVNWHPGDKGMAAYANAFWTALNNSSFTPIPASAETPATPPIPNAAPAAATSTAGQPVEVDEIWGDPPSLTWDTVPSIVQEDGRNVAKITAATTAGSKSQTALDVSQFAGRDVAIHTRIKADSVSVKPHVWSGIKLTLCIKNAEGKLDYPDYRLPSGTFDWTDLVWRVRIPDNTVSADLIIGLEDVSGTVWYDAIQISAGK